MPTNIDEATRRDILDHFTVSGISWSGRLSDCEFLARLYDLSLLPSHDHRFGNAAGDISQHTENWLDWQSDWVFTDSRFNLLYCSDEEFLRFLSETVHPVVRPDSNNQRGLVEFYNKSLGAVGWQLAETPQKGGRPVFSARELDGRFVLFAELTGWQKVDRQLQEAKLRLQTADSEEQFQAVGLICREALITVGQANFDSAKHTHSDQVSPSDTDAKRLLDAVFDFELQGSANEEARAHAKAAVKLAYALQHKRTANFRMAALCMEATASVVNLLAVLAGRRS